MTDMRQCTCRLVFVWVESNLRYGHRWVVEGEVLVCYWSLRPAMCSVVTEDDVRKIGRGRQGVGRARRVFR